MICYFRAVHLNIPNNKALSTIDGVPPSISFARLGFDLVLMMVVKGHSDCSMASASAAVTRTYFLELLFILLPQHKSTAGIAHPWTPEIESVVVILRSVKYIFF